jgi:conjugative transfer pilus assembly protein TraH
MSTTKQRRIGPALMGAAAVMAASASTTALADIEDTMEAQWGSMVNQTDSSTFETQGRGVLSGGSLSIRNDTMNWNPITVNPPNVRAGCGGIDLFGGSFSMINKDQFVQLVRRIASNAVGYSFQLAMDSMCPTCNQLMQQLQSKVQDMTGQQKSSCQMAKELVNKTGVKDNINKWGSKVQNYAVDAGNSIDIFSSGQQGTQDNKTQAQDNTSTLSDPDSQASKAVNGNVVWSALESGDVEGWFVGGDDELKRTIMSLTGSRIVKADDDENPQVEQVEPTVEVEDIMRGGDVEIYKCPNDQCISDGGQLPTEEINIKGMRERTLDLLLTGSSDSIVDVIMTGEGQTTAKQRRFIQNIPMPLVGALHRFGDNPAIGRTFVKATSDTIAMLMVQDMVLNMVDTVSTTLGSTDVSGVVKYREGAWSDRKDQLLRQIERQKKPIDQTMKFFQHYQNVMESIHTENAQQLFSASAAN